VLRSAAPSTFVLLVVGLVVLLLMVAGIAVSGASGGLIMAGLVLLVVGGAAILGRGRWAFITSRKVAAGVAAAGVAAVLAGGATAAAVGTTDASASGAATSGATASGATATVGSTPSVSHPGPRRTTTTTPSRTTATTDASTGVGVRAVRGTALAALAPIPVKGRAPMTGYSRHLFGSGWVDTDHDGCDTRNDILTRDLARTTFKAGAGNCVVLTGRLADPYSGRAIAFKRGLTTSNAVQIDHVVALGDAWQTGARQWSTAKRTAFANDRLELLAVDGPLNEAKGDADAASWLPPNKGFRCAYVARQVAVKATYGLWMTQAEKSAIAGILATCPWQPLPSGAVSPAPAPAPVPVRTHTPVTTHAATVTTHAPKPAPTATVHPGAFCSTAGATGVTSAGTPMVCRTSATDSRLRWRSAA
jgi:Protein of unknown function (DUF1524)